MLHFKPDYQNKVRWPKSSEVTDDLSFLTINFGQMQFIINVSGFSKQLLCLERVCGGKLKQHKTMQLWK